MMPVNDDNLRISAALRSGAEILNPHQRVCSIEIDNYGLLYKKDAGMEGVLNDS